MGYDNQAAGVCGRDQCLDGFRIQEGPQASRAGENLQVLRALRTPVRDELLGLVGAGHDVYMGVDQPWQERSAGCVDDLVAVPGGRSSDTIGDEPAIEPDRSPVLQAGAVEYPRVHDRCCFCREVSLPFAFRVCPFTIDAAERRTRYLCSWRSWSSATGNGSV